MLRAISPTNVICTAPSRRGPLHPWTAPGSSSSKRNSSEDIPTPREDVVVFHPLDNACWHALRGPHAHHAEVAGSACRYDPEVSVFSAVEAVDGDAWSDLARLAGPGAGLWLFRDEIPAAPAGWTEDARGRGVQMVLHGALPDLDEPEGLRPLGPDDAPAMMALIAVTTPGPFRPRTVELGGYVGAFDGGHLVAMAGERLSVDGFGEISAVCTHPDARGRGLAAALTRRVAAGIAARGDTPYLQVAAHNTAARRIYERLGFEPRREVDVARFTTPG